MWLVFITHFIKVFSTRRIKFICSQALNHKIYLQTLSYTKSLEYGIDHVDYSENDYKQYIQETFRQLQINITVWHEHP